MKNRHHETFYQNLLNTIKLKWNYQREISFLNKWTGKTIKEIIFDSSIHSYEKFESEFHEKVINRKELLFVVKSIDGYLFGQYVQSQIQSYGDNSWIEDEKSFIFSFKENIPIHYPILQKRKENAFKLCSKHSNGLFAMGFYDIFIRKHSDICTFYQGNDCSFDYNGKCCPIVGKIGFGTSFKIDHIWLFKL